MAEYSWLRRLFELYGTSRYILVLSPDEGTETLPSGEKKLQQLREYVEDRIEASDTLIMRNLNFLEEKIAALSEQTQHHQVDHNERIQEQQEEMDDRMDDMEEKIHKVITLNEKVLKNVKKLVRKAEGKPPLEKKHKEKKRLSVHSEALSQLSVPFKEKKTIKKKIDEDKKHSDIGSIEDLDLDDLNLDSPEEEHSNKDKEVDSPEEEHSVEDKEVDSPEEEQSNDDNEGDEVDSPEEDNSQDTN